MKFIITLLFFLMFISIVNGQNNEAKWFSESATYGIVIQNSLPKGGSYPVQLKNKFNTSYLVFFTRITNETENPLELTVSFSSDSIAIPNSPGTFIKIVLPQDTMTFDKVNLFNYGIGELKALNRSSKIQNKLQPKEDCLFYVVALFFQTSEEDWSQERGGNRAELILNGEDLFLRMPPQIDTMHCGKITFAN